MVSFVILLMNACVDSRNKPWTNDTTKEWMEKGTWRNGLNFTPDSSINAKELATKYHKNSVVWDSVFNFLKRSNLDLLPPGKYGIYGENAFAIVSEYVPMDFDQSKWESHRKYIDLQTMISGKEKIGIAAVKNAIVTVAYNDSTDAANYETTGDYFIAVPKTFFLFFPANAHRPSIKANNDSFVVKKLVIKIKFAN